MEYTSLSKLFYTDNENYINTYNSRFNNEYTIHFDFSVSGYPAFFVPEPSFYQKIVDIYKTDKRIKELRHILPKKAIEHFALRCLIDEIILTNNIEGVFSSRREISSILTELENKNYGKRYTGLVQKYLMLQKDETMSFNSCEDIRNLYNDLVYSEVAEDNPENLPDGKIFRKDSTSVVTSTQKEIHRGLYPESNIIEAMNKALNVLNNENIAFLFRISIFHYLFGYIHPFYDGNGRTSRFISSYLLSKEFESIIAYRISFSIRENLKEYYQAFKTCNDKHNRGDLTPFVIMFIDIISESFNLLENALLKRYKQLDYYFQRIKYFPDGSNEKYASIYFLLIQASLFSENGISTKEIMDTTNLSRTTVANRLKRLSYNNLIIKKTLGNLRCYSLNLDVADKFAEHIKNSNDYI